MKERNTGQQQDNGEEIGLLGKLVRFTAVQETRNTVHRHDMRYRLDDEQLEIFSKYYASYRILRTKENAVFLDDSRDPITEEMSRLPIVGRVAGFIYDLSDSMRDFSQQLKDEGDQLADDYMSKLRERHEGHEEETTFEDFLRENISARKIQLTANMLCSILCNNERSSRERKEIATRYLDWTGSYQ